MQYLNETDRRTMVAMAAYPSMTGKEQADMVGISHSGLLRSRKRLLHMGLLRMLKIPSFGKIGHSILFGGFGALKKNQDISTPRIPGIFFLASEQGKGFGMGASRDYSDFYSLLVDFRDMSQWIDAESFGFNAFPVNSTDFWRIFDFGPLLASEFSVDIQVDRNPNTQIKGKEFSLDDKEWRIYREMISHPEYSVFSLSQKLGMNRQKIYRADRKFREEGLYVDKVVPNLKALGYEVLMFVSWKNPGGTHHNLMEKPKYRDIPPWATTLISTPIESIMIAAFGTFRRSRAIYERIMELGIDDGINRNAPQTLFLSMQDTYCPINMDFSNIFNNAE